MGYIIHGPRAARGKVAKGKGDTAPVTVAASLAFHWYDEIAAGRKKVEYREITDYWSRRLWDNGITERIQAIKFTRGYTPVNMTWEVTEIVRDEREGVFEIHLGKRIA